MESAIAQLRSMPVELEAFLKFVETVQPHLTKGDAAQRLKADVDAIGAMKDLLAQAGSLAYIPRYTIPVCFLPLIL